MKEIKLSQQGKNKGKHVALVDDEDYAYLSQWRWLVSIEKVTNYARRTFILNGKRSTITMHCQIMNTPIGLEIDHKDHNGLNNQKSNLRICTRSENVKNRRPRGVLKYKGICYKKPNRKFQSQIYVNGNTIYLGIYDSEIDAAMAYDLAAKKYHGEFACLNFK